MVLFYVSRAFDRLNILAYQSFAVSTFSYSCRSSSCNILITNFIISLQTPQIMQCKLPKWVLNRPNIGEWVLINNIVIGNWKPYNQMRVIVALSLLLLGLSFTIKRVEVHPTFEQFIEEYHKIYDASQYLFRRSVYHSNLQIIDRLNFEDEGTAVYGVNEFADRTTHQMKRMYGVEVNPNYKLNFVQNFTNAEVYEPLRDAPDIWNWQQQGATTSVRNQGSCGSCWAFSTAQNVESQYWMKTKQLIDFSEQQLVDCDKSNFGCSGGWPYMAIDWLAHNGGLMTMADYPTRANYSGPCQFDQSKVKTQIKGYMNITKNQTIIKDALYTMGPLSILLDFTGLSSYKGGVASPRWCSTWPDHALLMVGYGTKDGDYWLIKNSWGPKWGINGYLMLERGKNKCGVAEWATTALIP